MRHIQVLDTHTINKIAAGEVVERPGSVVKELVENAIDADASAVTIEIRDGGISYIRVTDNGRGIPRDDVKTAFLRHATNKITSAEDLEEVLSLGFRGEALASIAAVSQVEMLTKTADSETGASITIHGGEVLQCGEAGLLGGTTIVVQNLFYNVPARRKFLKKPAAESAYIGDIVNKMALGHPEIAFQYINNDTTILQTSGNHDLKAVAFHVYGKEAASKLIPVSQTQGEYSIHGLIGRPELSRANRSYENLFINGRYVKNDIIASAVEDAYKTRVMGGKFPVFILNLEVPADTVDVNVHPTKLEVRFRDEDGMYDLFYKGVQKALQGETLIPEVTWDPKPAREPAPVQEILPQTPPPKTMRDIPVSKPSDTPPRPEAAPKAAPQAMPRSNAGSAVDQLLQKLSGPSAEFKVHQANLAQPPETPEEPEKDAFFQDYRIVGRVFSTYWIVEQGDAMYLIDQHAAHERVLYERFLKVFQNRHSISQPLIASLPVRLTPQEKQLLAENRAFLLDCGFTFAPTEEGVELTSVPYLFQSPADAGFFTDLLDMLADNRVENMYDAQLHAIATMACKAAVKAGDQVSDMEARELIKNLLSLENPFNCPHGRPTIIAMSRYELEKKFKRIV